MLKEERRNEKIFRRRCNNGYIYSGYFMERVMRWWWYSGMRGVWLINSLSPSLFYCLLSSLSSALISTFNTCQNRTLQFPASMSIMVDILFNSELNKQDSCEAKPSEPFPSSNLPVLHLSSQCGTNKVLGITQQHYSHFFCWFKTG